MLGQTKINILSLVTLVLLAVFSTRGVSAAYSSEAEGVAEAQEAHYEVLTEADGARVDLSEVTDMGLIGQSMLNTKNDGGLQVATIAVPPTRGYRPVPQAARPGGRYPYNRGYTNYNWYRALSRIPHRYAGAASCINVLGQRHITY